MSSSSTSPPCEFDVFVSFRGEDVRYKFIEYLKIWLKREGFSYFYDDEPEHAGKKIEEKIFPAIHRARVALIVLSEKYAGSKWCLNELVEILNSQHKNLVVIPIFYGVEPADVKNLKSNFRKAFDRFCEDGKKDQQKPKWAKALEEVKEFTGLKLEKSGNEPDLLESIVQSLHEKICPSQSLNFVKNVIGVDRLVEDMNELLKIGQEDVRVIGISGAEGIGKTTVAKAVFIGTRRHFKRSIFLDEVGEAAHNHLVKLQKNLLQNLIKINEQLPHGISGRYSELIKNNLHGKKILLVLDGVTKKEQREKLGVEELESFCPGSRILITTRDKKLLKDLDVDDTYNVEGLYRDEAFRLFCRCAFKREEPEEGYEELSRYLSHYAGGHPSALRKWGSFLKKNKSKEVWQKFSDQLVKNSDHINSIKTGSGQIFVEYPFKVVGPCGGDRITKPWQDKGYTGVKKIDVGFDSKGIKFITVLYDEMRRPITHGTIGGETSTFLIDPKDRSEYLTSVSGHTKKVSGRTILQSLTFYSNRGNLKRIGTKNDGRKFSFPYTGGKIIGFRGSCNDSHLESIGAFYERIAHTPIGYSGRVFGPFGGAGEISWHSNKINGIFVGYTEHFINEITFKVREATSSEPRTYKGNGKQDTFEVKLETLDEYITSFSGYFENAYDGRILIKSLTFRTSKRILGPIGREGGTHFSSPSEAVKVIRFFGRSDDYLETIGARVEPYSEKLYPFKSMGLFGSSKGSTWDDRNDHTNVTKILAEIESGDRKFIRSIKFCYEKNGRSCPSEGHGGATEKVVDPIKIHYPNEYLTSMSGYYLDDGITSLTFGTNKRTLEPIGREEGIHFSSPVTGGKIVGFYGRSDENLKAIGAYFEQVSNFYPIKSIGPFGGSSGQNWDGPRGETANHRKFKGVREIEVVHNINIHCIKFVYDDGVYDDGKDRSYSVEYKFRAEGDYPEYTKVTLDYPREYLTSISGYVRNDAIQSLTFYSNKRTSDPCGEKMGKYFWYPSNGSRITSFYGTRDPDKETLKSIGVYVEPIPRMYPFKTVGPFGGSVGTEWDDGVHTDVRGFRISFGKAIKAIGIAYDNNGSFVSGSEHGSGYNGNGSFASGLEPGKKGETNTYKQVILDYPKERLRSISIWVDEDGKTGHPIIHDLRIFTTEDNYGPFIPDSKQKRDKLTQFHIPSQHNDGRILGFFGRVGRYLHSIGARLEP